MASLRSRSSKPLPSDRVAFNAAITPGTSTKVTRSTAEQSSAQQNLNCCLSYLS